MTFKPNRKIVWLEDPLKFTYLREHGITSCGRFPIRFASLCDTKVVGYEKIRYEPVEGRSGLHYYRYWHLRSWDRDRDPNGVYKDDCPCEAVVPSSIKPGEKSRRYYPVMMAVRGKKVKGVFGEYLECDGLTREKKKSTETV
jgi:hypothetical protein